MQTFLPYASFEKTMGCLDDRRLGNQVYRECLTLIRGGWENHPASKMWVGHFHHLALYGLAGLQELKRRGRHYPHHVVTFMEFLDTFADNGPPPWLGNRRFHRAHQSNLVRKDPDHYRQFFPNVPDNLPYVWPI